MRRLEFPDAGARVLGARDPLPGRPHHILVAGATGAGKTTLADRIAARTGLPRTELDALHHGPGWTKRPGFEAEVTALAAGEAWVVEWQFRAVRPLLAERAELLVHLDLPYWRVVLPRVVRRTWRRRGGREPLWNGNLEPPLRTILTERDHIIRWSIRTRRTAAEEIDRLLVEGRGPAVVRLRSVAEVEAWLDGPLAAAFG